MFVGDDSSFSTRYYERGAQSTLVVVSEAQVVAFQDFKQVSMLVGGIRR